MFPQVAYPRIPGHEIVGEVAAILSTEKLWKVGQRVGGGWHGGHCHTCERCRAGDFSMCALQDINGEVIASRTSIEFIDSTRYRQGWRLHRVRNFEDRGRRQYHGRLGSHRDSTSPVCGCHRIQYASVAHSDMSCRNSGAHAS